MFEIAPERASDAPLIEILLDNAFGPGRFARAAYRLREGSAAVAGLSFCARLEGRLAGSVSFWPIRIGNAAALLLGPLAVDPAFQGKGAGRALLVHGCEAADETGHKLILLVGDLDYYAFAGFHRIPAGRVSMPAPVDMARLLWRTPSGEAPDIVGGAVVRG